MQSPGKDARAAGSAVPYERHRPETTLLYQLVEVHYPVFVAQLVTRGTPLPEYVQGEFTDYLRCGRLEHGFLRVRCESCHGEHLVAFSCKRRGFCPSCGARRMAESAALLVDEVLPAVPMRQWVLSFPFPLRFLFASRPKIMGKVLGIVYRVLATHLVDSPAGPRFRWIKAPSSAELRQLSHTIAHRVSRFLERQGLLVRDDESAHLTLDTPDDDPMHTLIGHSITYRIATGPRQGRKVLTPNTPCHR